MPMTPLSLYIVCLGHPYLIFYVIFFILSVLTKLVYHDIHDEVENYLCYIIFSGYQSILYSYKIASLFIRFLCLEQPLIFQRM